MKIYDIVIFIRYGVYVEEEKNDLKLILNRFFGSGITSEKLETILSLTSCNVHKVNFLQTIDQQLCLMHCPQKFHTREDNLKLVELFNVLTDMCNAKEQYENALIHGIVESINFISDDFNAYLKENYLISLTLIFLQLWQTKNVICNEANTLEECRLMQGIFTKKSNLKINEQVLIPQEVLQLVLAHIPILQSIIEDQTKKNEITMYELLDGFKNLNTKLLFKWRFKNEDMPAFTSENLIKKHGYRETLTYNFYLKEGRPNMAAHCLKHAQAKLLGNLSSQRFAY